MIDLKNWRDLLDERQQKDLDFATLYVEQYNHGIVGHNQYALIARLALLLDAAAGTKELPQPPAPGDRVLGFGKKHKGKKLSEIAKLDPDYLDWLSREANDLELRAAAQAVLAAPSQVAPQPAVIGTGDAPPPEPPGEDVPF